MYVLMDMEWVENREGKCHPTQIAAMRVDEGWENQQLFSTRIQPPDKSFYMWDHVGYTGGYANEFLSAPPAKEAFEMLRRWLEPEDVLCWWKGNGIDLFCEYASGITQPNKELYPYLCEYFRYSTLRGSPYRVVGKMGMGPCGISNHSKSDVKTMRAALEAVRFPQIFLEQACTEELHLPEDMYFRSLYVVEVDSGTVHRRGCPEVQEGELQELPSLRGLKKKDRRPCYCCAQEYLQERRRKNKSTIERSEYAFVYTPGSAVFHRRNCPVILTATEIMGTIHYKSCIQTGRRPCLTCKPTQNDEFKVSIKALIEQKSSRKKATVSPRLPMALPPKPTPKPKPQPKLAYFANRGLTEQEKRAMRRLAQAKEEREKAQKNNTMTQQQKDDMLMLTQPSYGFWAATGYSSFHLRHCGKLNTLSNFRGFSRYEDAVRAGYQPCRQCKPTARHNLEVSLPIYSEERNGETIDVLEERCQKAGFHCGTEKDLFLMETPMGIWRIHTKARPYTLEHINKNHTPNNRNNFHVQPKIFLSLTDVFTYIKKHDGPRQESSGEGMALGE